MRFSEYFGIETSPDDEWFDPDLTVDTKLFVDPFLLLDEPDDEPVWGKAHDELIGHFSRCYDLVAKGGSPSSLSGQVAFNLLKFHEPYELGLGYTRSSTRGSGSGTSGARKMLDSIAVAIRAGLDRPEHIEEIGILNEGIGADKISDATCNVLKHRLIEYTKVVAERYGIPVEACRIRNAQVSLETGRWIHRRFKLPTGPSGDPILLVPKRFLNDLPVLNADDWFDSTFNADLRRDMNVRVGQRVAKSTIVDAARKHTDRVRQWARYVRDHGFGSGYDFDRDPRGVYRWDEAGSSTQAATPWVCRRLTTLSNSIIS